MNIFPLLDAISSILSKYRIKKLGNYMLSTSMIIFCRLDYSEVHLFFEVTVTIHFG